MLYIVRKPAVYTEEQRVKRRAYTRAWLAARGPGYRASLHTPSQRKATEKLYNDRHSERRKEYYRLQRITNRAATLEKDRLLRERKRDELRAYFRNYKQVRWDELSTYHKTYHKAYRKANPHKCREYTAKYRLNKKDLTLEDCSTKIRELMGVANCHWCGCKLHSKNRHIDHVIPISKGGPHSSDNLVAACSKCNCSKGAKLPHEWKPQRFKEAA